MTSETHPYYCYLLKAQDSNHSYAGITNNLPRRIRQHNGLIKGSAKYTKLHRPWLIICAIGPFQNKITALQFEWRVHHPPIRRTGIAGKILNIQDVLNLSTWTSNAPISSTIDLKIYWFYNNYFISKCPPQCNQIYLS